MSDTRTPARLDKPGLWYRLDGEVVSVQEENGELVFYCFGDEKAYRVANTRPDFWVAPCLNPGQMAARLAGLVKELRAQTKFDERMVVDGVERAGATLGIMFPESP